MRKKNLLPFNIQFFADGEGDPSGEPGAGGENDPGNGNSNDNKNSSGESGDGSETQKTFTQEQVTAMMAREKRQGRNAVIKDLGFKSENEAKNAFKLLSALLDSQKTPEDKAKDGENAAKDKENEALRRAEAAENKLACLMAGVNNDSIEDALAIALLKVTEEKPIDKVLAEMKKEKRYSSFFGEDSPSGSGTGSKPGHSKDGGSGGSAGDYGKSLAEASITSGPAKKKSSYFMED